jgi:hypothetical protein
MPVASDGHKGVGKSIALGKLYQHNQLNTIRLVVTEKATSTSSSPFDSLTTCHVDVLDLQDLLLLLFI